MLPAEILAIRVIDLLAHALDVLEQKHAGHELRVLRPMKNCATGIQAMPIDFPVSSANKRPIPTRSAAPRRGGIIV